MRGRASRVSLIGGRVATGNRWERRDLRIEGGRIVEASTQPATTIDLAGAGVLPGLINCHDHLQLNGAPELRPRTPFPDRAAWADWLREQVELARPAGLEAPVEARHWQGGLKNLLAGTTTVAHHDPAHPILSDPAFPVRVAPGGWCHSLDLAGEYGPSVDRSLAETPGSLPWTIHLAEGTGERVARELEALRASGGLTERTLLVHGVALDDAQHEELIAAGAAVIWGPTSNQTLLGRTLDPRRLARDRSLALGSDSRLSGARDLLEELRGALAASPLDADDLLPLVTTRGADLLRLPRAGRLEPGSWADLLLVNLRMGESPADALLRAERADLLAVARAGVPRIACPDFANWFEAEGIEPLHAHLDDRPKLLSPELIRFPDSLTTLEPGLQAPGPS